MENIDATMEAMTIAANRRRMRKDGRYEKPYNEKPYAKEFSDSQSVV